MPDYTHFISCDWGTSNFRLAVVEMQSLEELHTHETTMGIKNLFGIFQSQSELNQKDFFAKYFLEQLDVFPVEFSDFPVVISGMASANIGMQEMEYAVMPIDGEGKGLIYERVDLNEERSAILISGARSDNGVMRGEEVQAVGLSEMMEKHGDGTLILPGTHSKHLSYVNERFEELKTFMTGELFALLSRESVLSSSITEAKWDVGFKDDFIEGVKIGSSGKLTEKLFSIRVNGLLNRKGSKANYFLLSGMIIGDEVRNLQEEGTIFLAASSPLIEMYGIAIKEVAPNINLVKFGSEETRKATLRGQRKVLM